MAFVEMIRGRRFGPPRAFSEFMRYWGVGTPEVLEAAAGTAGKLGDVLLQAEALLQLGMVALQRSDHNIAQARFEEAQPLYEQLGDLLGQANCIQGLGDIALARSDFDTAKACYEEALTLYHRVPDTSSAESVQRRLARLLAKEE
jgi:tetratricopeptide (TPR) repeat protein